MNKTKYYIKPQELHFTLQNVSKVTVCNFQNPWIANTCIPCVALGRCRIVDCRMLYSSNETCISMWTRENRKIQMKTIKEEV